MQCAEIRGRFSALIEGDLPHVEENEIRDHLSSCAECGSEFAGLKKTLDWLHSVEEIEPPEELLSGVEERLQQRNHRPAPIREGRETHFPFSPRVRLPLQALAMIAIVLSVFYVTRRVPVEISRQKTLEPSRPALTEERRSEPAIESRAKDSTEIQDPKKTGSTAGRKDRDRTVLTRPSPAASGPQAGSPVDLPKPAEKAAFEETKKETDFRAGFKETESDIPAEKSNAALSAGGEMKQRPRSVEAGKIDGHEQQKSTSGMARQERVNPSGPEAAGGSLSRASSQGNRREVFRSKSICRRSSGAHLRPPGRADRRGR
jgi:hypothetical protein